MEGWMSHAPAAKGWAGCARDRPDGRSSDKKRPLDVSSGPSLGETLRKDLLRSGGEAGGGLGRPDLHPAHVGRPIRAGVGPGFWDGARVVPPQHAPLAPSPCVAKLFL